MLWAIDEARTDWIVVDYAYFETEHPLVDEEGGTYVETDVEFRNNLTHSWNHGLGEIVTALANVGMQVTGLVEHDSAPWDALPGQMTLRRRRRVAAHRAARAARLHLHAAGRQALTRSR